jgi:ornithine cyclodeaminase/alanine dehydrogenase-like protein (mu-crystallin family)
MDTLLLLDNDDVRRVLDVDACLAALEQAYRAQAAGTAVVGPRSQTYAPPGEPGVSYCLKTMEGALPGAGYMVLRLTSDIVGETVVEGVRRREKLARGPGGTYCGLIVLFDTRDLAPVAIIHDGYIQLMRVACTSALGSRLLAAPGAGDLGLLGSGGQAWSHLVAYRAVHRLRRVRVYSPSRERREAFAERAARELGLGAVAVASAREAVEGADLVVAATNASEPIVDGRWIAPGAHVVSIVSGDAKRQRRELDDETLRRAAVVIAHSKQAAIAQRHGDLALPVERGVIAWDRVRDLSELVAGEAEGRRRPEDITVFKNNGGLGLQFAAVAPRVYEAARAAGAGRALPRRWFLQQMKP